MLWKQEKMRRRCGSFGGTATRRFAARVSGNWHKMLKKGRRKTVMCSATTGTTGGPLDSVWDAPKGIDEEFIVF